MTEQNNSLKSYMISRAIHLRDLRQECEKVIAEYQREQIALGEIAKKQPELFDNTARLIVKHEQHWWIDIVKKKQSS